MIRTLLLINAVLSLAACSESSDELDAVKGIWQDGSPEAARAAERFLPGHDSRGGICRFEIDGATLPGTLLSASPEHGRRCEVSFFGRAHHADRFEVLVANEAYRWTEARDGAIPGKAVIGGQGKKGDALYICKVKIENREVYGKIRPVHDGCLYPKDGAEKMASAYWVLTVS